MDCFSIDAGSKGRWFFQNVKSNGIVNFANFLYNIENRKNGQSSLYFLWKNRNTVKINMLHRSLCKKSTTTVKSNQIQISTSCFILYFNNKYQKNIYFTPIVLRRMCVIDLILVLQIIICISFAILFLNNSINIIIILNL